MKKILLLAALTIALTQANAQKQFGTRNAKVNFVATNDEDVKAVNNEVASRLSDNGQLSFSLLIKGFKFEYAEMQEKFNNDYAESNKFPRAEFKGNISNIKEVNFTKDGTYKVVCKRNPYPTWRNKTFDCKRFNHCKSRQGFSNRKISDF